MPNRLLSVPRPVLWILCAASLATAADVAITKPADCERLPAQASNLCKMSLVKTGEFKYTKIEDVSKCRFLPDSSQTKSCVEALAKGEMFVVTEQDMNRANAVEYDTEATRPEQRKARALEEIAFYTKVQSIAVVAAALMGVLLGIIAVAN